MDQKKVKNIASVIIGRTRNYLNISKEYQNQLAMPGHLPYKYQEGREMIGRRAEEEKRVVIEIISKLDEETGKAVLEYIDQRISDIKKRKGEDYKSDLEDIRGIVECILSENKSRSTEPQPGCEE